MELSKDKKKKIEECINNSTDYLEDALNDRMREILEENSINDKDAIVYAREVFFRG